METTLTQPGRGLSRKIGYFLLVPVTVAVILSLLAVIGFVLYEARHADSVYTGVSVWGVDLSGLNRTEALAAVEGAFPYPYEESIRFEDPETGRSWTQTPAALGLAFNVEATVDKALALGRDGNPLERIQSQWQAYYYGRSIAPIVTFDEAALDRAIAALASEIDRPPADAELVYRDGRATFTPAQTGRLLDRADTRQRLLSPLADLRQVEIELLVHETDPNVLDTSQTAAAIDAMLSAPITFYLPEPLDGDDLDRVEIPVETLSEWLRIEPVAGSGDGPRHNVFMDPNGVRAWLSQFEDELYREPERARYYFDDPTEELVLVEPHVNGRELDIEGTLEQFNAQIGTSNRSVPFVMREIVPVAHSEATAQELGITELLHEQTTFFYGSSPERKHNIARSAANFYGIVIGPGEEFSFNRFLGEVSEEQGYETGLIILGGRTVEGVGGGVCQVSTTVYQAAWWAGFPIEERLEHGYQVGYYDDGEGTGMDATVYNPLVDLRFLNNTPYHLLIENYYNEVFESLTVKFYSTSLGREVEKAEFIYENVQPPRPDVWEFNPELEPGEVEQVDWAVEGADVRVRRIVYNADGQLIGDEWFVSNYIPWQNVYQYGPGADLPPGVARDPEDPFYQEE